MIGVESSVKKLMEVWAQYSTQHSGEWAAALMAVTILIVLHDVAGRLLDQLESWERFISESRFDVGWSEGGLAEALEIIEGQDPSKCS